MKTSLEKALEVAIKAHSGQKDKAGAPYILHPIRVMMTQESNDARIIALLHDVVEDSGFSLLQLEGLGFSRKVVSAVKALTKKDGEKYENYLKRVSKNRLAISVKLADLQDNMNLNRLKTITEKDSQRFKKYRKAVKTLKMYL